MSPPDDTPPRSRPIADARSRPIEQAVRWLNEVDGRLMCKREDPDGPDGWVAIVKTPAPTGRGAELILGFGDSPLAAVETAQDRWRHAWREISSLH